MSSDTGVTITLKTEHSSGGPWVVIKGADVDEARDLLTGFMEWTLGAGESKTFPELVHNAQLDFNGIASVVYGAAPGVTRFVAPGAPVAAQNAAPQAETRPDFVSPAAPNLAPPAPQCHHGEKVYKSGQGQKGPWAAWMCRAAKEDPGKCKPVDAKTGQPWK